MALTEELFADLARKILGTTIVKYGEHTLDLGIWQRLSMRESIAEHWPKGAHPAPSIETLASPGGPRVAAERFVAWASEQPNRVLGPLGNLNSLSDGELTGLLFEQVAEEKLIQPTLLYDFPSDISPLAKARADDPSLAERFEVFVAGMELGNAFSELNDPEEQERRFREQVHRGGDEAPRVVDSDYIRALAHGMPPAAGMGIGIDRLTMLFTDSHSIREVILFPLLRPEAGDQDRAAAEAAKSAGVE
jgi:lysyl-tRNA synthetase class 2